MIKRRLQVFVSSTFDDLQVERQAAVSAILKAGHIPAGMELFTSADRSQWETIRHWIDESDAYMLILGGRYGSVEPTSGKSYTELEYDYALKQKKPLFAVVINEDALEKKVRSDGTKFMEKMHPQELDSFRTKVLSNISSFFDDSKDIKLCVHETLADYAANRKCKGWVRGDEVADTTPLIEEIKRLTKENAEVKKRLVESEKKLAANKGEDETMAELCALLTKIQITVPAAIAGGKDVIQDLCGLFYANKETLIRGITNRFSAGEVEDFYYNVVCPKLQVHGLTESERVPKVGYRRFSITPKGARFLAYYEKIFMSMDPDKRPVANPAGAVAD